MNVRRLAFHALAAGMVASCQPSDAPAPRSARLPAGVVARLGGAEIRAETVERIARAQHLSLRDARERAITDAAFAAGARERVSDGMERMLARAAYTRALLERIRKEAESRGPPTDDEIAKLTAERWVELDRPRGVKVSHAVARIPKSGGRESARRVAQAIAEAVRGITDPAVFLSRARDVPANGIEVRAEQLPPMTADGRGFSLEETSGPQELSSFDVAFAEAAAALDEPGAQSPVVETRFGFHVILLERVIAERRVPLEDRRQALAEEILSRRGSELRRRLLDQLAASTPVSIQRDSEARMAELFPPAPR